MKVSMVSVSRRRRPAALRAGRIEKALVELQRFSPGGQNSASSAAAPAGPRTAPARRRSRAVDHRDGRAPIALAADQPVVQAIVDLDAGRAPAPPASVHLLPWRHRRACR